MDGLKHDAYIALIALILFTLINFLGGLVNDIAGSYYGTDRVIECIPLHLIFCSLFWISCIPEIPIKKTLRFPLFRALFWFLIYTYLLNKGQLDTELIDSIVPFFCFFLSSTSEIFNTIGWPDILYFKLYGVLIIGVTLYQVLILEISTTGAKKLRETIFKKQII
jgi:hypothetical protein